MLKKIISVILCTVLTGINVHAESVLDLSAKSAILIEQGTGNILYEKNPDERLPLASVTKVMTMLLTMEAIDDGRIALTDMVVASERAKSMGGSTIFLDTGEEMSVHDLLKGIAVASGNDACVAMAEYIAGSEEAFVSMMNTRAAELGMVNTNFVNTNGLDADGHYSSARDIAIMSRELLKHKKIFEYTTIWMDSLRDGKFQLANTNKLIRFYKGANGLKTGSTDKALCCLAGSALRDNLQLICVVMAAPTSAQRFEDAKKILDYGFVNYAVKRVVTQGENLGETEIFKGTKKTVSAMAKENYDALTQKGNTADIKRELVFDRMISAPVDVGDRIGEIRLSNNEGQLYAIEIVAAEKIDKITFGKIFGMFTLSWLESVI